MKTISLSLVFIALLMTIAGNDAYGQLDLGAAANFGVLGINGASVNLSSGPLVVNGNVGVGNNGQFNFSSGTVNGNLYYAPSASVNITGGTTYLIGSQNSINFSTIDADVLAAVAFANSQTPTETFNSITTAMTLDATGNLTVIAVTGNNGIHLSGGNLVLNGSASDTFIFQIPGGFQLSGNTDIVLTGGLLPQDVLWDFTENGGGNNVQTSGNSDTAGVFLAPNLPIQINGGDHDSEFISGVSLSFQSNPQVTAMPAPSAVPEPSTWISGALLALALGASMVRKLASSPAS